MNNLNRLCFVLFVTLKCSMICVAAMPSLVEFASSPPIADCLVSKYLKIVTITDEMLFCQKFSKRLIARKSFKEKEFKERFIVRRKVTKGAAKVDYFKTHPPKYLKMPPPVIAPVKICSALFEDGALRITGPSLRFYKIQSPAGKIAYMLGTMHNHPINIFPKIVMEHLTRASTIMGEICERAFTADDLAVLESYTSKYFKTPLNREHFPMARKFAPAIKEIFNIEIDFEKASINREYFLFLAEKAAMANTVKSLYQLISFLCEGHDLVMDAYLEWHAYKHGKPFMPLESFADRTANVPLDSIPLQYRTADLAEERLISYPEMRADTAEKLHMLHQMLVQPITPEMQAVVDNYKLATLAPLYIEDDLMTPIIGPIIDSITITEQDLAWIAHRNRAWVQSIKRQMKKQTSQQTLFIGGGWVHMQIMLQGYIRADMPQLLLSEGFQVSRYNPFSQQWTQVPILDTASAPTPILDTASAPTPILETASAPISKTPFFG